MAYTPELSVKHSCTLRRIAWAMDMPMTQAIEEVFDYLGTHLDFGKVCDKCRDNSKCADCVFNHNGRKEKQG
jgi:hypothetical protein